MAGAGSVRAIRQRISSVENTAKVTGAMELVAASKMRRAQERALNARPYATEMRAILSKLSSYANQSRNSDSANPLLSEREVKNFALIHITADRGLAGGLNANMNRASASLMLERQSEVDRASVLAVGRKGRDFFRRSGFPELGEFTNIGDFPDSSDILPIARMVIDDYVSGAVDQVFLGFQTFVNAAVQRPTLRQILPINPPEDDGENEAVVDFLFEPSPDSILENLLPRYVEMQVFEAVLEAQASEQSARMVAMRQATDAANEMVSDLTLTYNKARQELITGELLDIVGGKAALEQD
ncbi:MAG: ATP synthase F1 subunit gamma [Chloroflexi bacterium]|nr:ATP synthase F1 subunit gamma [Chloroflexota bacterium]MCH2523480.1 ATP synthase F1 subunit gamma [Dehalococcoidia bacterium]|tara:strand:+ start:4221 stop:5117 length:897 start_codon:yes stop_codon:yes gene_type:complete